MSTPIGFRSFTTSFAAAVLLVACSAVATPLAAAATPSTIVGAASGRCLDVTGNNPAPGTGIIIFDCNGQSNQAWNVTAAGELRAFGDSVCLDSPNTAAGTQPQINACNTGANQQWSVNSDGTITSVQSGLCLDVRAAATGNFSQVVTWPCNGQSNQQWKTALASRDTQPPSAPSNPRTSGLTCSQVTLSWDASRDNVAVTGYDVYHDGQLIKSVDSSVLSTSINVVAGVRWGLYLNARDASGNISQASTTAAITPPQCQADTQAPTAPTTLKATTTGTSVALTWSASTDNVGVRYYDIYRSNTRVGTVSGTATTAPATKFSDSGLTPSTSYSYYVIARDAQSNASPPSGTVSVKTAAACSTPICSVSTVTTDNDIPWGLATLPDGTILYTRRDAQNVVAVNPSSGTKSSIGTAPNVSGTDGEGGLTGLAIASTFSTDHWIYLMHTSPTDNRVVRIKYENGALQTGTEQVLLSGILRNKYHDGGRLRFGPDGKLYVATGDAQNGDNAQDLSSLNGKILRMNPDGSIPSDNPFGNYIWSYGHRNPQGLAFDSQGRLWEQEFGNSTMDETNLITRGGNYGWPACEGTAGTCGTAGFIAPKYTYPVAEGSCSGIAIVRDVLYVACERGARMYRAVISGTSLTNVTQHFVGTYGRLRTVEPAPGGGLWLTTTNTGDKDSIPDNSDEMILRVVLG